MNTAVIVGSWVRSVALATMAVSIMLVIVIIAGEEIPALKNWLKATFYHHWLGKGALALMLFAAIAVLVHLTKNTLSLYRLIFVEAVVAIVSALAIAGFFILHLFHLV